jgi:dihydrofolate reductase
MRKLISSMGVSLDGFIAGPDGAIDWTAPDEELHRFRNQQAREIGAHLYGGRLYDDMRPLGAARPGAVGPRAGAPIRPHLEGPPKIVF